MADVKQPMAMGATLVASSAGDLVHPGPSAVATPEPAPEPSLVGSILLERYRILERLGAGGMGVVYLAEHVALKKRCAIKVLSDEFANKQDIVDRFLQEARAASMIAHENVVEITDYGQTPTGSVFFVMEMLVGEDLSHTIGREGPLPWERVRPMMVQICRALAAAHDKGIIHRDMKPENCFRIERGGTTDFIKVLDFGIAKVTGDDGEGKGLTKTGMIFGTPEYMSPEQAQGMRVDHRADIYAVGIILYELLTGRVPFTADTFMGVLTKHMFEVPVAPSSIVPGITPEVESVILKALQKDREHRFSTMREFLSALDSVASGGGGVAVVQEKIVLPPSGPLLAFGGTKAPAAELAEARSTGPVWILVIVGMLAAAAIAAVLLSGGEETPAVAANVPVEPPKDVVVLPTTPEKPPEKPPEPAPVAAVFTTNVLAEVVDPSDGDRVLGKTNGSPIELAFSDAPRQLVLRADGYDEQTITVTPNQAIAQSVELHKRKKDKGGKAPTKSTKTDKPKEPGPGEKPPADPKTPPDKPKDPPPDKPGTTLTPPPRELKDPFGKRGSSSGG